MDKIEKIRQEIERQQKSLNNATGNYAEGRRSELDNLLSFLDTLEAEERPEPYIPVYDEEYLTEKQRLFKEHHGEVDVDKMLAECRGYDEEKEEPDKDLEEAAMNYIAPIENEDGLKVINFSGQDIKDAFIAGAEWQAEQDDRDVVFWKGMQHAIKGMKEEAVEGIYTKSMDGKDVFVESGALKIDPASVKVGDPVRIIVLPKED